MADNNGVFSTCRGVAVVRVDSVVFTVGVALSIIVVCCFLPLEAFFSFFVCDCTASVISTSLSVSAGPFVLTAPTFESAGMVLRGCNTSILLSTLLEACFSITDAELSEAGFALAAESSDGGKSLPSSINFRIFRICTIFLHLVSHRLILESSLAVNSFDTAASVKVVQSSKVMRR